MQTNEKIIAIVKKLSSSENINEESTLIDLGIDSLNTMDLLIMIEEEFNLDISEDYLVPAYFKSVITLTKLVNDVKNNSK